MARWLITGAGGMLGRELVEHLSADGGAPDVTALTRAQFDITDAAAAKAAVSGHDVVINAAAWTDVDRAEAEEDAATAVNGTAVRALAEACLSAGAKLIHVSTDYVFPGNADSPIQEDAPTAP